MVTGVGSKTNLGPKAGSILLTTDFLKKLSSKQSWRSSSPI